MTPRTGSEVGADHSGVAGGGLRGRDDLNSTYTIAKGQGNLPVAEGSTRYLGKITRVNYDKQ